MIFVALLLFDTQYPVDTAMSILMTLVGFFNLLIMCIAPGSVATPNLFGKMKDDTAESRSEDDYDENSENDADEHDGLLPRTYQNDGHPVHRNLSNKPENSAAGLQH